MTMKQGSDGESALVEALRGLKQDTSARSETARLRDIFDEVEAALKAGVRREAVLATLHEQGFTMTLLGFKTALQRIRKERTKT
jgi:hypothetical protein